MHSKFWAENQKGGDDHLEVISIDGKIVLEWILGNEGGKLWTGCIRLRIGTSGRLNEPSCSTKEGEFLDYQSGLLLASQEGPSSCHGVGWFGLVWLVGRSVGRSVVNRNEGVRLPYV